MYNINIGKILKKQKGVPKYGKITMAELTTYNAEERANRLKEEVQMGIIPKYMISEIVELDSSIPQYAREEVKRLALKD